jgi:putative aldouronate transport system permease protein
MTEKEIVTEGYKLIPRQWSTQAYDFLFRNPRKLIDSYEVTIFITVVGTAVGLFVMSMTGYVLNRKDFLYRSSFSIFFYFPTLFSAGLVPTYILYVQYLGFKDTIYALLFPGLIGAWSIFLMRNFLRSIPDSLYESATIERRGGLSASTGRSSCRWPFPRWPRSGCSRPWATGTSV